MKANLVNEQALIKKLCFKITPWLIFLLILTIMDRVNIGYSALGMNKELGISMTAFGTIAGIYYIAYFIFEIPSNLILHRVGARRWIARIVVTWGLVTLLTGFVRNTTELGICRFLLGAMEAGFYPGIILYFTYWFPAKHQAKVVSLLMIGSAAALVIGGPIATYILSNINGFGLSGWRWIFILEGGLTVIAGIVTWFVMLDYPRNAEFLSVDEKQWIEERIQNEQKAKSEVLNISKWGTMKNIWVWYFTLCYFGCIMGLTLLYFWMPQILKRLSTVLSDVEVGWISSIPYVCAIAAMVLIAFHSDKTKERRWHAGASLAATALALVGLTFTSDLVMSVILLCVAAAGAYTYMVVFWALPTAVLSGTSAAVGIALINSIGNLGGFFGPSIYGYLADLTKSTVAGTYVMAAFVLLTCVLTICVPRRFELASENQSHSSKMLDE